MARSRAFHWSAPLSYEVYPHLAGISLRDFHLNAAACAQSFRVGGAMARALFGPDVGIATCYCPPNSYGHIACLGAEMQYPEFGAPAVMPIWSSLGEGIRALKAGCDFETNRYFGEHMALLKQLRKEFPEEKIEFSGFGKEGIITSAVLLRGQEFYMDIYDDPPRTKEFLGLLSDGIIRFEHFCRRIGGRAPVTDSAGIADDYAALIPPGLWPEFVLPYWAAYFRATTNAARAVHCEGLSPGHLEYLNGLGLDAFDPDLSPQLTPKMLGERLHVPFAWSLQSFDYPRMTHAQIEEWVADAAAGGASRVYSCIYVNMCEDDVPAKVRTFLAAAKRVASERPTN